MMVSELTVGLGNRTYPIFLKTSCLEEVGRYLRQERLGNKYAVITDSNVADLYGDRLLQHLKECGLSAENFVFAAGEKSKNLTVLSRLASALANAGFDRKDAIIALGGGVPGDMAGFLASMYMRGIAFVQVPTTLLAQVDSSVGGKTGVDIPEGKNLLGAFYQPQAVFIDPLVLETLPRQELLGGLAEVIKYAIIRDKDFFQFLANNSARILAQEKELLLQTIATCCQIKAEVVVEDEREGGMRRILNYGHTIGHAVEAASGFSIIHGLAVAIGMAAAARIALHKGLLSSAEMAAILQILRLYDLPDSVPEDLDRQKIKQYLLRDKKVVSGKVHYILPTSIGSTLITPEVSMAEVDRVLEQ
ncbi:MAG: 3-dehydroquinate synthase [Deltaproteobacteria bacterium]|nr:MAG: 3-dehydroquinate synthase [Deltaproteobacteria bacterium]